MNIIDNYSPVGCCNADCVNTTCDNTPVGGIALVVASIALKSISRALAAPLLGMGASMIVTTLVKNGIDWYDNKLLVHLKKETHKLYNRFEYLHLIAVIFSFAISFIYCPLGLIAGILLGTATALVLDTETSKLGQQANRRRTV